MSAQKFQMIVGQKFGRLTVVDEGAPYPNQRGRRWVCLCQCGTQTLVAVQSLQRGLSTSCGCWKREATVTHGRARLGTRDRTYGSWESMKQRCYNPNSSKFYLYGAQGITVCTRWLESFENFLADMGPAPTKDHSIDRIDGTGSYTADNCRWATRQQQQRNLKTCRRVLVDGELLSFRDACDRVGISPELVNLRVRRGWSFERAMFTSNARQPKTR